MALGDPDSAAGEATAAVSMVKRASECRRNRPGARPDLDEPAVGVGAHDHAARIAREALGRFRGNARAIFEDGVARLVGVRQDMRIDVHYDLVALAGGTGVDLVMQRRLHE